MASNTQASNIWMNATQSLKKIMLKLSCIIDKLTNKEDHRHSKWESTNSQIWQRKSSWQIDSEQDFQIDLSRRGYKALTLLNWRVDKFNNRQNKMMFLHTRIGTRKATWLDHILGIVRFLLGILCCCNSRVSREAVRTRQRDARVLSPATLGLRSVELQMRWWLDVRSIWVHGRARYNAQRLVWAFLRSSTQAMQVNRRVSLQEHRLTWARWYDQQWNPRDGHVATNRRCHVLHWHAPVLQQRHRHWRLPPLLKRKLWGKPRYSHSWLWFSQKWESQRSLQWLLDHPKLMGWKMGWRRLL